jgi:GAF domain-containing protein
MFVSQVATVGGQDENAEAARLAELTSYGILDTAPEEAFDRVVELARVLFDTPIATITLVDHDRQWFKARSGLEAGQTPREQSFCDHAMRDSSVFVVPDARDDPRFSENPLVTGAPNIRFYAGAALHGADGHSLGAVCVISPDPRDDFTAADKRKLEVLARIVETEMELKKAAQSAHTKDIELREAHFRIKNSLDYADLLAEVQASDATTAKLSAIAMAAWKQYTEAGGVLASCVKSLRDRMGAMEYKALLDSMPGFAM